MWFVFTFSPNINHTIKLKGENSSTKLHTNGSEPVIKVSLTAAYSHSQPWAHLWGPRFSAPSNYVNTTISHLERSPWPPQLAPCSPGEILFVNWQDTGPPLHSQKKKGKAKASARAAKQANVNEAGHLAFSLPSSLSSQPPGNLDRQWLQSEEESRTGSTVHCDPEQAPAGVWWALGQNVLSNIKDQGSNEGDKTWHTSGEAVWHRTIMEWSKNRRQGSQGNSILLQTFWITVDTLSHVPHWASASLAKTRHMY